MRSTRGLRVPATPLVIGARVGQLAGADPGTARDDWESQQGVITHNITWVLFCFLSETMEIGMMFWTRQQKSRPGFCLSNDVHLRSQGHDGHPVRGPMIRCVLGPFSLDRGTLVPLYTKGDNKCPVSMRGLMGLVACPYGLSSGSVRHPPKLYPDAMIHPLVNYGIDGF